MLASLPPLALRLCLAVSFSLLSACGSSSSPAPGGGGGGGGGETDPFAAPDLAVAIQMDRSSGEVGTTFQFSGVVISVDSPVSSWQWQFGDGNTASGQSVSTSFASAGVFPVSLTALTSEGTFETGTLVVVFDPASWPTAPGGAALPALRGDVNGDGALTMADVHALREHYTGTTPLDPSLFLTADTNRDGSLNRADVNYIALAILEGADFPKQIEPAQAAPGATIHLTSASLLDTAASAKIVLGSGQTITPFRPAPGEAVFTLPLALAYTPFPSGALAVDLQLDGNSAETYSVDLQAANPGTGTAGAAILSALELLPAVRAHLEPSLQRYLTQAAASTSESRVAMAAVRLANQEFLDFEDQMVEVIDHLHSEVLVALELAARANDFDAAVSELQRLSANWTTLQVGAGVQGDVVAENVVLFLDSVQALQALHQSLMTACQAVLGADMRAQLFQTNLVEQDRLALFNLVDLCTDMAPAVDGLALPHSMMGIDGFELMLTPDSSGLQPGQWWLEGVVVSLGLEPAQAIAANVGGSHLRDLLNGRASNRLLLRIHQGRLSWQLLWQSQSNGRQDRIDDLLADAQAQGESGLDEAGFDALLESLAAGVDSYLGANGVLNGRLPIELNGVLGDPNPNVGLLTLPEIQSGDPAFYECPAVNPPGFVAFVATRPLFGNNLVASANVPCDLLDVSVLLTDPGAQKDDFYELKIDGVTVLVTTNPAVSLSGTFALSRGQHTVEMVARRSGNPGTVNYQIAFSGAEVESGDALNGDIPVGSSVSWVLGVPTIGS
jgi:PKD domain-containing protein/dockerin type I repeat protein